MFLYYKCLTDESLDYHIIYEVSKPGTQQPVTTVTLLFRMCVVHVIYYAYASIHVLCVHSRVLTCAGVQFVELLQPVLQLVVVVALISIYEFYSYLCDYAAQRH